MSFRRQVFAAFQPLVDIALFILVNTALFFAARLALLYFLLPDITERGHIPHALYIGAQVRCPHGRVHDPASRLLPALAEAGARSLA